MEKGGGGGREGEREREREREGGRGRVGEWVEGSDGSQRGGGTGSYT